MASDNEKTASNSRSLGRGFTNIAEGSTMWEGVVWGMESHWRVSQCTSRQGGEKTGVGSLAQHLSHLWNFPECVRYLLQHNKLLHNAAVLNNKCLFPHSFCGSGIQDWLSWVILVQGLSWDFIQYTTDQSGALLTSDEPTHYNHPKSGLHQNSLLYKGLDKSTMKDTYPSLRCHIE